MSAKQTHIDKALAIRMLRGQQSAFNEFFNTYADRLFRFALYRLDNDHHAAEEIVQSTLCQAIRKLASWHGDAALFTWLCAICRNQIGDYHRRQQRTEKRNLPLDEPNVQRILQTLEADTLDSPEQNYMRGQLIQLIQAVLDHLPGRQGDALEWKYIRGLSVEEIAAELRVSQAAAQSLLARARGTFRQTLQRILASGAKDGAGLLDDLLSPGMAGNGKKTRS